ncbi:MAG: NAD(P)H-hydrate dehydratase [Roseitalea sp.]|nr:NAD(P)H-hydrate dehydratase [Roseitalea sp.]MBO6721735.1 NAD(P)H-hydrate dehydratase [Roseitalea sp.]MBO6741657.1 NAD(P)H-hydrate dehydratase [Roseitalea sp.]
MGSRSGAAPLRDIDPQALMTTAEMAAADRATIESGAFSGITLMERAGSAVADAAMARFAAARVHVLCGPGNNGGDGYVAARILANRGVDVHLYALAPPKAGSDAALAADTWYGPISGFDAFAPDPNDLVIDAVFGAGFSGALPDPVQSALARAADRKCPVLAVDLPSGVNGDTGQGAHAIGCAATVTFYRRKPGHLVFPGRALCGETIVADIGVRATAPTATFENAPDLWRRALPRPCDDTHKYARGAVAVFSGPRHGTGASRLAAMAAQRAGAGAVTLLGHPDALDIQAAHVTAIMLSAWGTNPRAALAGLKGIGAVVLGPGFGDLPLARSLATSILDDRGLALVLDADGITAFADDPEPLFDAARARDKPALVLTPHAGEFARLFPDLAADVSLGKLAMARAAAARSGAILVFKGADTVIAAPGGAAVINANATPALATAGSGDVLAGAIAGLAAQGMPAFESACAAVWLHGEAGRAAGPVAIAEELVAALPEAFAALV